MKSCYQFKEQSVLEHGKSVFRYYEDLLKVLSGGDPAYQWKLPDWLLQNKEWIKENQHGLNIMKWYLILHDCGKPRCRTVDEEGKQHFPNHAQESFKLWHKHSSYHARDQIIGELIRNDMFLHTCSAEDLESFAASTANPELGASLLCSAFAELHSNAAMFGGLESGSFKMKYKQLDRRGKKLLSLMTF